MWYLVAAQQILGPNCTDTAETRALRINELQKLISCNSLSIKQDNITLIV